MSTGDMSLDNAIIAADQRQTAAPAGSTTAGVASWAALWLSVGTGSALVLPSLWSGLFADDYLIQSQLRSPKTITGLSRGPWDLFAFVPREGADTQRLIEQGIYPWWTDPQVKDALGRPLPSLTHALDAWLWPHSPVAWHAHSLVWFSLALVAVGLFYRQLFRGTGTATLATALFALDDAHGTIVGWLSARHTLIALTFGALAMWAHARWRMDRWRPGALVALAFLALGMLSSEIALGAVAYLFAFEVFLSDGSVQRRAWRLLPFAGVVAVWAAAYAALRFGAAWHGIYLDPIHDPLPFARELVFRLPVLLAAQLFGPRADLWTFYPVVHPQLAHVVWGFDVIALVGIALIARPACSRDPVARMAACGMVLSAVPVCAGFVADRVLAFVGIGGMALTASVITHFLRAPRDTKRWRRILRAVPIALIAVVHGAWNLYSLPARSGRNPLAVPFEAAASSLAETSDLEKRTLVIVHSPYEQFIYYAAFMHDVADAPRAGRVRLLSAGLSGVSVTRLDDRTLRVKPDAGYFETIADSQWRTPRHPLGLGRAASLSNVAVDISALTLDGRPAEAVFHFQTPLDGPEWVWLSWGDHGYESFRIPAVGSTLRLEATGLGRLFTNETPDSKPMRAHPG
jgi:hypothetical protein